jgi:FkbM family methyltransferase
MLGKFGFLDSKAGFSLYVNSYFFYKRFFEAKGLLSTLDESFRLIKAVDFTFVDIGCHIGFVSSYVAKKMPNVKVLAVDPDKRNIEKFMSIAGQKIRSPNLIVENLAIWEFDGSIPFAFEDTNTANNRFRADSKERINCLSLETLLADYKHQNILIKIDVQGFEPEVLNGAKQVLINNKVLIIVEIDELALGSRGSSSKKLLSQLELFGYHAWDISTKRFFQYQDLLEVLATQECIDLLFLPFPGSENKKSRNM